MIDKEKISGVLKAHIALNRALLDCPYRIDSDAWFCFFEMARELRESGDFVPYRGSTDEFIINETDLGRTGVFFDDTQNREASKKGIHKVRKVNLDSPRRTPPGDSKKYQVYVDSGRRNKAGEIIAKLVKWGDPDMVVRNFDDSARKNFLRRHRCSEKKDRTTPGWWACNIHLYADQLNLSSKKPW